jgi:hypothetical protein
MYGRNDFTHSLNNFNRHGRDLTGAVKADDADAIRKKLKAIREEAEWGLRMLDSNRAKSISTSVERMDANRKELRRFGPR